MVEIVRLPTFLIKVVIFLAMVSKIVNLARDALLVFLELDDVFDGADLLVVDILTSGAKKRGKVNLIGQMEGFD